MPLSLPCTINFIGNSFLARQSRAKKLFLTPKTLFPIKSYADYLSKEQQRRYALQGGLAVLLVTLVLLTSLAVS
jgi:hypothetical protein